MYFSSRTRKRSGRGSLLSQPSSLLLSRRLVFFNLCVRRRVCTDKSERESSPAITPRYNRSECGKKLSRRSDSSINTNEIHQTIHEQTLKTNFPSICGEIFVGIVRCSASYLFSLDLSKKKKREDLCFFGRRKKTYDACFALFHFYFALENPIVQELHHISTDPLQHSRSLIMRTCVYAVPRTIVEKRARASTRVCTC